MICIVDSLAGSQLQSDNFRGNAKPYRNDARADTCSYIEIAIGLADVPTCISLPISRWHHQCAEERQIHLPSMSMPRQRQADARRNPRKYVRTVCDDDDWTLVADLREGALNTRTGAYEVLKTSQPESTAVEIKSHYRIAQHSYSNPRQSRCDDRSAIPIVVIAKDGINTQPRVDL